MFSCILTTGANVSQNSTFSQDPSQSLNASSVCSVDLVSSINSSHTKSLRKSKRPQNSVSPQSVRVDESTVLAFPVATLSKKKSDQKSYDSEKPVSMVMDACTPAVIEPDVKENG